MATQPLPSFDRDARLKSLIEQRKLYLEVWRQQASELVMPWKDEPHISLTTGSIWHQEPSMLAQGCYTDNFMAYIVGVGYDGLRYFRTVKASGRQIANGEANEILIDTLCRVAELGPDFCTVVEEGGLLPKYEDQIELKTAA